MKHIPIMLALALSISLTSYDENTIDTQKNMITEATTNIVETVVLDEEVVDKSELES